MAWIEIQSKPETIVTDIATQLVANGWVMHDSISADKKVVKTTTDPDVNYANKTLTVYIIIERAAAHVRELTFSFAETWDEIAHTGTNLSNKATWGWYKDTKTLVAGLDTPGLNEQLPIMVWGSINNNRAILSMMGDPTLDFDNYIISYGYLGRLIPFNADYEDIDGNFALAFSCSDGGLKSAGGNIESGVGYNSYGSYTASGNYEVMMYKSKSGLLYQAHHVSFITQISSMVKDAFNPSRWTSKFHLSPIYIVHGYDGYRGRFEDLVGLDQNSIVHLDELTVVTAVGPPEVVDTYKFIAPKRGRGFLNDSPNINYGLGIKKV